MTTRYWVCIAGYNLSFLLALGGCIVALAHPAPAVRMLAAAACFGFGWGARTFWERAATEFRGREERA